MAASRPEPGPFTNTSTYFNPCTNAAFVAVSAAICAAYGVDFNGDEEKIVAHLFKLYSEKTANE